MTKVFRSVRFNIFLGAGIALASAVGTFIPQISDAPEKVDIFISAHPQLSRLLHALGAFNLYSSWWFMALLGLMAFDIALCKLWSRPPDRGLTSLPPEVTGEFEAEKHLSQKDAALRLKPHQAVFTSELSVDAACAAAQTYLRHAGYHVQTEFASSTGAAFTATRHRLQRWGSYVAHIALVIILLGALSKGIFGFVEMVPVAEGGSRAMTNRPAWNVCVDKFSVRYYPGTGNPSYFSSIVRVETGGKTLGAKTIAVNDPLDIDGVRFYQASWGAGGMFRSVTLDIARQRVVLPQGQSVRIKGTPFTVTADMMIPNFNIGADGKAETDGLDLQNPAVRFVFSIAGRQTPPLWLLTNNPAISLREDPQGVLAHADAPPFKIAGLDPVLFSGIQIAYDPGYKIVLLGSILWLCGMLALYCLHRRRLWVLFEPMGDGCRVAVGGWSSRGAPDFRVGFEKLMRDLSTMSLEAS